MTSINIKKLLKNTVSLLLTLLIMSSILDFIRKPTVPDNLNATALYDLQGNPFFLPQLDQDKPTVLYFWGTWCSYCRYTRQQLMIWQKKAILWFPLHCVQVLHKMWRII